MFATPSMMMKAVVYMSKKRGGHHYIFGNVLGPGKAPEPEDNMIGGQVIINKTNPDYFIVSKLHYLWSIGRYYSNYIDNIVEVSTGNNGVLNIVAAGHAASKTSGQWELKVDPAAMYMVQDAKFTRFVSNGELAAEPEVNINSTGIKWFGKICIPGQTFLTGLDQTEKTPVIFETMSMQADLEFIEQANNFLNPPYKIQTTYSIISDTTNIDNIYKPGEREKNVSHTYITEDITVNLSSENHDNFQEELLNLQQQNPQKIGVTTLIDMYEKFISKYQDDPRVAEAIFDLANRYENDKNFYKAMELFEKAAKTAIPNTDTWKKANIYWFNRVLNDDIQKAENILLDMKKHLRENDAVLEAEIEDRYVYFYGVQKRFDEAEKSYSRILELNTDRTKITDNIDDRIIIENCFRTSSQNLLACINNAIDLTPAKRLALIKEIGNKYNLFTIFDSYNETIKQLESHDDVYTLLKAKIESGRIREYPPEIKISDEQLREADPKKIMEILVTYETDPCGMVQYFTYNYEGKLADLHKEPEVRQKVALHLVKAIISSYSYTNVYEKLLTFTKADFNDDAKGLIRTALAKDNPSRNVIRICGVADMKDEIPRLQNIIDRTSNYNLFWTAHLAKARMGVKEDINEYINYVESITDQNERVKRRLPNVGYIRQPEAIEYLKKYLESDGRLPPVDNRPGPTYASRVVHILAESLENFPIKQKDARNYTDEEIELCRKWMSEQKKWQIIR